MKEPKSKLPLKEIKDAKGKEMAFIHSLKDTKYILQACNRFPKAIELLKESLGMLSREGYQVLLGKDIEEFLKSLE